MPRRIKIFAELLKLSVNQDSSDGKQISMLPYDPSETSSNSCSESILDKHIGVQLPYLPPPHGIARGRTASLGICQIQCYGHWVRSGEAAFAWELRQWKVICYPPGRPWLIANATGVDCRSRCEMCWGWLMHCEILLLLKADFKQANALLYCRVSTQAQSGHAIGALRFAFAQLLVWASWPLKAQTMPANLAQYDMYGFFTACCMAQVTLHFLCCHDRCWLFTRIKVKMIVMPRFETHKMGQPSHAPNPSSYT